MLSKTICIIFFVLPLCNDDIIDVVYCEIVTFFSCCSKSKLFHCLYHIKNILKETLDKDKTKYLCGTAPWAAPEVLRGEKAQTHSDIW